MAGPTELRPVQGGCRHLRARYKVERRGKSLFPELDLVRYECEQSYSVDTDDELQKCMGSHIECWQKG